MLTETQACCDILEEKYDNLLEKVKDIADGSRKKKVTDWWLQYIGQTTISFLEGLGFRNDVLPNDYLDTPPIDMQGVLSNLVLLKRLLSGDLHANLVEFVEQTAVVVYEELDHFISDLEIALENNWSKLGISVRLTGNQVEMISSDLEYLKEMKQMDEEIKRSQNIGGGKEKPEVDCQGNIVVEKGERKKAKKLVMSHVVPIRGLILAKFHILDCELQTALMRWKHLYSPESLSSIHSSSSPSSSLSSPLVPPDSTDELIGNHENIESNPLDIHSDRKIEILSGNSSRPLPLHLEDNILEFAPLEGEASRTRSSSLSVSFRSTLRDGMCTHSSRGRQSWKGTMGNKDDEFLSLYITS